MSDPLGCPGLVPGWPYFCCPQTPCINMYRGYGFGIYYAWPVNVIPSLTDVISKINEIKAILGPIDPENPGYGWNPNPGYSVWGLMRDGQALYVPAQDQDDCYNIPTGINGYGEYGFWLGWAGIRIYRYGNVTYSAYLVACSKLTAYIYSSPAWCISTTFQIGTAIQDQSCEIRLTNRVQLEVPDWYPTVLPVQIWNYAGCTASLNQRFVYLDHQKYERIPWPRDNCPLYEKPACCPAAAP